MDDDDFDGVQYDTFHAPDAQQLEATEIRRECAQARTGAVARSFGIDTSEPEWWNKI